MTWKIDHENMQTRTWVCSNCGCTCLSKNPWMRHTHGEGTGNFTDRLYLSWLQNVSSAYLVDAKPARPKEREFVCWTNYTDDSGQQFYDRNSAFCMAADSKDIAIFINPGNNNIQDTGKPLKSPAERMIEFFRMIREMDEELLGNYACAQFNGHSWTDDPEEIKRQAEQREHRKEAAKTRAQRQAEENNDEHP